MIAVVARSPETIFASFSTLSTAPIADGCSVALAASGEEMMKRSASLGKPPRGAGMWFLRQTDPSIGLEAIVAGS
jgi:hypothetical protein